MKQIIAAIFGILVLTLAACGGTSPTAAAKATATETTETTPVAISTLPPAPAAPRGAGMGPGSGMMARHQAKIPAEYADLKNPVPADDVSIERGAQIYTTNCAVCHGDGGMGDGPAGTALDPAPVPIAHTSQMLGDNYLFWRISEGGAAEPFNSAMPAFSAVIDEQGHWDVINYVRALGQGKVMPSNAAGGAPFDPAAEAKNRAEMLSNAVKENVLTQAEADLFNEIHAKMDAIIASGDFKGSGAMSQAQEDLLTVLVANGEISQQQADDFNDIHNRLEMSGLMK